MVCGVHPGNFVVAAIVPALAMSTVGYDGRTSAVDAPPVRSAPAPNPTLAPWDASGCGDDAYQNAAMERHPRLMRQSPDELRQAFGAPSSSERFVLGDAVGTFRGGRAAGLPGGEAANARRVALETTWTKQGCNLTVRYIEERGRWRAFEAFEWSVGADF